jgi:hypothetical protein
MQLESAHLHIKLNWCKNHARKKTTLKITEIPNIKEEISIALLGGLNNTEYF